MDVAISYHDAVYVPGNSDNEEKSVEFMMGLLEGKVSDEILDTAADLILHTKSHTTSKANPRLSSILNDLDFHAFMFSFSQYMYYTSQIYLEYAINGYSFEQWCKGRQIFLNDMLLRPAILVSEFSNAPMNSSIRRNMNSEKNMIINSTQEYYIVMEGVR